MRPGGFRGKRLAAGLVASALLCLLAGCVDDPIPPPSFPPAQEGELHIAVPGYVNPPDSNFWQSVVEATPHVRDVIVNPRNGPGTEVSEGHVRLIRTLREANIRVLGYVMTGWGDRDEAAVIEDINRWREWYGVDNIFLDEASTGAEDIGIYADYAAAVHEAGGIVVLNPGLIPDRGYFEFADAIVTFEDPVDAYFTTREPPEWLLAETRAEVWHIVIDAPEDRLQDVIDRARELGVDEIYVTDDAEPNPYDSLPTYWLGKLEAAGA